MMNQSGLRERKKRQSRARILASAAARFQRQGVREATIAQIAADAEISEATFFNYFRSKDALVAELVADVFDYYAELLSRIVAAESNALSAVRAFFRESADIALRNAGLTRGVLLEVMRSAASDAAFRRGQDAIYARFTELLEAGQRSGQVRSDWSAAFVAEMVNGAFNEVIGQWLLRPDYPLRERLAQAGEFITAAIAIPTPAARGRG